MTTNKGKLSGEMWQHWEWEAQPHQATPICRGTAIWCVVVRKEAWR